MVPAAGNSFTGTAEYTLRGCCIHAKNFVPIAELSTLGNPFSYSLMSLNTTKASCKKVSKDIINVSCLHSHTQRTHTFISVPKATSLYDTLRQIVPWGEMSRSCFYKNIFHNPGIDFVPTYQTYGPMDAFSKPPQAITESFERPIR